MLSVTKTNTLIYLAAGEGLVYGNFRLLPLNEIERELTHREQQCHEFKQVEAEITAWTGLVQRFIPLTTKEGFMQLCVGEKDAKVYLFSGFNYFILFQTWFEFLVSLFPSSWVVN